MKMNNEENYIYLTIPSSVSSSSANLEMILTPISPIDNVEDAKELININNNRLLSNVEILNAHCLNERIVNQNFPINLGTIELKSNDNEILTISTEELIDTTATTSSITTRTSSSTIETTASEAPSTIITIDPNSIINFKRYERLRKDIVRKKMARMRETEQQRSQRLKKDRERKKLSRQNETFEQRQRRLEKDRLRIKQRRAMESDEERRKRLEKNRISKRVARIKENNNLNNS